MPAARIALWRGLVTLGELRLRISVVRCFFEARAKEAPRVGARYVRAGELPNELHEVLATDSPQKRVGEVIEANTRVVEVERPDTTLRKDNIVEPAKQARLAGPVVSYDREEFGASRVPKRVDEFAGPRLDCPRRSECDADRVPKQGVARRETGSCSPWFACCTRRPVPTRREPSNADHTGQQAQRSARCGGRLRDSGRRSPGLRRMSDAFSSLACLVPGSRRGKPPSRRRARKDRKTAFGSRGFSGRGRRCRPAAAGPREPGSRGAAACSDSPRGWSASAAIGVP